MTRYVVARLVAGTFLAVFFFLFATYGHSMPQRGHPIGEEDQP